MGLRPALCHLHRNDLVRDLHFSLIRSAAAPRPILTRALRSLVRVRLHRWSRGYRPLGGCSRVWTPSVLRVQDHQQHGRLGPALGVSIAVPCPGDSSDCLNPALSVRLGVPYHSWRITHAKHHASTAHLTQDQVFVPPTRSMLRLPAFNPSKEDLVGSSVAEEVQRELKEALGDSPIGAAIGAASYLVSTVASPVAY